MKMAMKLLISEKEAHAVIGKAGAKQAALMEATNTRFYLSNQNEYYPGYQHNQLRELNMQGPSSDHVMKAQMEPFGP